MEPQNQNKKIALAIVLALTVVVLSYFVVVAKNRIVIPKQISDTADQQDQQILDFQKVPAIDGVLVSADQARRPIAVVVENHVDSRPQSGLSQADVVYEALAEGGITRFLGIFQTQQVDMIGPVRSARTYFNDWAEELNAIFAHVGGNSDALYYLKQGIPGISDADQFFNSAYFERIPPRVPPHNTYTSTTQLLELAAANKFDLTATFIPYQFKDDQPAVSSAANPVAVNPTAINPLAANIAIDFSEPSYAVVWKYDSATNSYKRYQEGAAVIDAGNSQPIVAKNIIVQRVANWPVQTDTPFSISMGTRAGGAADVFLDGVDIKGTWTYVNGRTKFFNQSGQEIKLNRGQIWIEIVPPANSVTVTSN